MLPVGILAIARVRSAVSSLRTKRRNNPRHADACGGLPRCDRTDECLSMNRRYSGIRAGVLLSLIDLFARQEDNA
jgi:hypothetical protein